MKHADVYHHPVPYVTFHGTPDSSSTTKDLNDPDGAAVEIRLNELGFRIEKPLPRNKPPEETRIFVLGSSTVFNGAPLSKSMPGQIEMCFRRNGRNDVEVYNFGLVSSVSGQELSLLVHLLSSYEPDAVVVFNGGNDVCLPVNFDPRPGYPYNFYAYESAMRHIHHQMRENQFVWVFEGNGLDYNLGELRGSCGYGTEGWEMDIAVKYLENLVKMGRFAKGCGFRLFAFLEPILFLKDPLSGKEKEIPTTCYGIENFDRYVRRQYERIRVMLRYLQTAETDDRFILTDLSSVFQGYDQDIYWDFRHVNNEGNRRIAEHIHARLKNFL